MIFTVYSKSGCSYCKKIEQVLKLLKLDYEIYKLDQDFTTEEFCDKFGEGSSFPQVVVDDEKNIGGCSQTLKYLREIKLI